MAEITRLLFWRHFRGEPSSFAIHHRRGERLRAGRGLTFWFSPLSSSITEIPLDDRELEVLFQGRTRDFQDVTVQGVITFRVTSPETLADRVDFAIDLDRGGHAEEPLDKLATLFTQLAQQLAWDWVASSDLRDVLGAGVDEIRRRVGEGLAADPGLQAMGLGVVSVRVSSVKPTAELERALGTPTRERLQQEADEATFQRRALAVEKERAIQENELLNQIELARREETLIAQRGQNEKRRMQDDVEAKRIDAEATALRRRLEATTQAEAIRLVEEAKVGAERERMEIYRSLPPPVMIGLAAQELAGKLQSIEHLTVSPELLGPLFTRLVEAGTKRLAEG
jgi:regulator of protease activity HflC (stomatin/prohibitin superfamily)